MTGSLRASPAGLAICDRARQLKGWTKTRSPEWWQAAHTSQATLRRFWRGFAIQADAFIDICRAVGIEDWQAIATAFEIDAESITSGLMEPDEQLSMRQNWNEAPDLMNFYGRKAELSLLRDWIVKDRQKIVLILGLGGVGKTNLVLTLAGEVQRSFEKVIWKALRNMPPVLELIQDLIEFLSNGQQELTTLNLHQAIYQLIEILQQYRCLIVLDELEALLQTSAGIVRPQVGVYQPGYEGYGELLQRLSRDRHLSCVVITSREKPQGLMGAPFTISRNRHKKPMDRSGLVKVTGFLELDGLSGTDAQALLQAMGVMGSETELNALGDCYSGNPFALKTIADIIKQFFAGNVIDFLRQNTIVLSDPLSGVLQQQFDRLSDLEREIIYWLAIAESPVSLVQLEKVLSLPLSQAQILEALISLQYRSLLEGIVTETEVRFGLRPMMQKLVRDDLMEQATAELCAALRSQDIATLDLLKRYLLVSASSDIFIVNPKCLNALKVQLLYQVRPTPKLVSQLTELITRSRQSCGEGGYSDRNLPALLKLLLNGQ